MYAINHAPREVFLTDEKRQNLASKINRVNTTIKGKKTIRQSMAIVLENNHAEKESYRETMNVVFNTSDQNLAHRNGLFESDDLNYKYKLGIIDFLTDYNTMKKMETTVNNMLHWKDKQDVSC